MSQAPLKLATTFKTTFAQNALAVVDFQSVITLLTNDFLNKLSIDN